MTVDVNSIAQLGFAAGVAVFLLKFVTDNVSKKLDKILETMEMIVKVQKGKK